MLIVHKIWKEQNKGIKMFEVLDKVCEPIRSTKYSAYVDLFAMEDVTIGAGESRTITLGVKIDLEELRTDWINKSGLIFKPDDARKSLIEFGFHKFMSSHYLEVVLTDSLAAKGLISASGITIINLDNTNEVSLIIHNPTELGDICDVVALAPNETFTINKGDKVAQCTLKEHKGYLMGYESDVVRDGGFGSTGDKA